MDTEFDIKINENWMLMDEIENKIQLEKWLKKSTINQKNEDQTRFRNQIKQMIMDGIEEKK
jgi:hypothetical protein